MSFLYFLQELRNPVTDFIFATLTHLGEEAIFLLVALLVFWCIDKKHGYYFLTVSFVGLSINQFLKLLCRIPRPWVLDPDFPIVESAREAATGYSFPSGHTQSAVGTFGGMARMTKVKWLRWVLIVIALLVSFSRLYLGVHTPLDVGVSVAIGTVLVLVLWPIMERSDEKPGRMAAVLLAMILGSGAFLVFLLLHDFPADVDADNLAHAISGAWKFVGATLGMLAAWWVEHRSIRFDPKADWWVQVIKIAGGLALVLAIKSGLKAPLIALLGHEGVANAVRYGLIVFFAGAVWPLTFKFWGKLGRK